MAKLDVKVGDKVIAWSRYGKHITEVTKITPTGRIRIKGSSSQFSPDGCELGGGGWGGSTSLHPWTEEIEREIREENTKKNAVYRMMRTKSDLVDEISLEDARTINRILLKYEKRGSNE